MEITPLRFLPAIARQNTSQRETEAGRNFRAVLQDAQQQSSLAGIDWRKDGFISGNDIVFYGRPEDYNIYLRKSSVDENYYIRRVGNDGFAADVKGKSGIPAGREIKLDPTKNIVFLNRSTNFSNAVTLWASELPALFTASKRSRYSGTNEDLDDVETTVTNSLYRDRFGEADFILGGAGNDQFRVGRKGIDSSGDFFDGGDGYDTVYLPGVASDYTFQRNSDYQVTIINKKTKNTLEVESVERIRFSGGGGNKGYISLDSLAPNK